MSNTYHSKLTDHTLFINKIKKTDRRIVCLKSVRDLENKYSSFWEVRNFNAKGVCFFIIGKYKGKKEYHVWFARNEKYTFWAGFGRTIEQAIEGAQEEGWMYA